MTLQDLRQFRSMRAEGKRISRRMHELRLEMATSQDEEHSKAMKELYKELEALHKKQIAAELEITRRVASIEDARARLSIEMHYIDGRSWNEVADAIGGNNTEDGCRMYVNRYIEKSFDKFDSQKL